MTIEQDLYTRVYQYKGYWKLTVQQHGRRKSFYSKIPGNAGRKECARQAAAWLAQDTPIVPSSLLLVNDVFPFYLKDRALQTKDILASYPDNIKLGLEKYIEHLENQKDM